MSLQWCRINYQIWKLHSEKSIEESLYFITIFAIWQHINWNLMQCWHQFIENWLTFQVTLVFCWPYSHRPLDVNHWAISSSQICITCNMNIHFCLLSWFQPDSSSIYLSLRLWFHSHWSSLSVKTGIFIRAHADEMAFVI